MKNRTILAVGIASAAVVTSAQAVVPVAGPIFDPYSNANLYIVPKNNWTGAQADSQSLGGNLITVHSAVENAFIVSNVINTSTSAGVSFANLPLWIGYRDVPGSLVNDSGAAHAGNFSWVSGQNPGYTNWYTGEPNDNGAGEFYTAINWTNASIGAPQGTWNDTPLAGTTGFGGTSDGTYYGIAAVPVPEPAAGIVSGIAGGILIHRRRRAS